MLFHELQMKQATKDYHSVLDPAEMARIQERKQALDDRGDRGGAYLGDSPS